MPVSRRPVGGNLTCQAPVFDGSFFILIPRPDTAAPIGNASASGNKTRHGRQHFREAPMPRLALGNVKSEQCCDDRWLKNRTSVLDGGATNKNRPEALSFWPVSGSGAGDGNRTRVISLEGWGSTIELRPQDMVGTTGFEPATSCSQSRRATKLRHVPKVLSSCESYRPCLSQGF